MRTVGLCEKVILIGKSRVTTLAKFDTGAKTTSIDTSLAKKAGLGLALRTTRVKSASRTGHVRKVVKAKIAIGTRTFEKEVNLCSRAHSPYKILIGRDIILKNFKIDVSKTHDGPAETAVKT